MLCKAPTPKQVDAALNFYAAAKPIQGNQLMTSTPPQLSMFAQLLSASASAARVKADGESRTWPVNPFPTGPKAGCTTERVLALLQAEYPKHLEHGELRMLLGATRGMITWSLRYLEAKGQVERVHDPRNSSYKRWRATNADS